MWLLFRVRTQFNPEPIYYLTKMQFKEVKMLVVWDRDKRQACPSYLDKSQESDHSHSSLDNIDPRQHYDIV